MAPSPAVAANPMGYRLLSPEEAASLQPRHGLLGLDVERAQQITDDAMTFDIIRVKQVRPGSAGAQAGLHPGDQIVAIDALVFPSVAAFAAYVGSRAPGSRANVDYIPAGGSPNQAQRVAAIVGGAGQAAPASGGMSTRTKIGIGAAALLGCYMAGCFSKHAVPAGGAAPQSPLGQ